MKALELVRAEIAALYEQRDAAVEALEAVATLALDESRSLSTEDDVAITASQSEITDLDAKIAAAIERESGLVAIEAATAVRASRPSLTVISKPDTTDTLNDRSATPQQLTDALTRSLEDKVESPENMAHVRKLVLRHRGDSAWTRSLIARSTDVYESAWAKAITGGLHRLSNEERTALSVITDANGGYLVPTHLDPSVILTNSGSSNALRAVSRVVTLTRPGDNTWNGVTSAGVTASFDATLTEVSDDTPTFGNAPIQTHKAQAFVQAAFEAEDDIAGLATEILMMFADAKDRLEGAAHCTGSGSDAPYGIFTALDANTNVELTTATAATLAKVDLDAAYQAVPVRFRGRSKWLMNPKWALEIQNLGTALSSNYSSNITEGAAPVLYGKAVIESDDAPTTATTTVRDNRIVFGDFSNYVIVDKPGSFAVDYIPNLFATANNLPDGRRGWFAHWRTGADSVNDLGFRLTQDKTSA